MRKTMMRGAVALLSGLAIAPVALAAQGSDTNGDRAGSQVRGANAEAVTGEGDQLVLRRDGSKAVPFEADPIGAPSEVGFQWDDALIGAASACAFMVLGLAGSSLIRRRRERQPLAGRPA